MVNTHSASKEECQKEEKSEVFTLRQILQQAVLPLAIVTDNRGEVQGLDRGEGPLHVGQTKMRTNGRGCVKRSEEWKNNGFGNAVGRVASSSACHGRMQKTNEGQDEI